MGKVIGELFAKASQATLNAKNNSTKTAVRTIAFLTITPGNQ